MTDYIDRQAAIDAINRAVTKEVADVRIMLSQLGFIFNNFEAVTEWEGMKLNRLWSAIHSEG